MVRHAVVGDRHAVVGDRQARPCNRSTRLAGTAGNRRAVSRIGRRPRPAVVTLFDGRAIPGFQHEPTCHRRGMRRRARRNRNRGGARAKQRRAPRAARREHRVHEQSIGQARVGQAHVAARPRPAVEHGVRPERQRRAGRSASRRPTCRAHRRRIRKSRRRSPSGIGSDGAFRRRAANATERPARELGVPPPRAKAHWRARPVVECAPPLPG